MAHHRSASLSRTKSDEDGNPRLLRKRRSAYIERRSTVIDSAPTDLILSLAVSTAPASPPLSPSTSPPSTPTPSASSTSSATAAATASSPNFGPLRPIRFSRSRLSSSTPAPQHAVSVTASPTASAAEALLGEPTLDVVRGTRMRATSQSMVPVVRLNASSEAQRVRRSSDSAPAPPLAATTAASSAPALLADTSVVQEEMSAFGRVVREGARRVLMAGSLRYVLEWLVHECPDAVTVQNLLLAHAHFVPSTALLHAIEHALDKYAPPAPALRPAPAPDPILLETLVTVGVAEEVAARVLVLAKNDIYAAMALTQSHEQPLTTRPRDYKTSAHGGEREEQEGLVCQLRLVNLLKTWLHLDWDAFYPPHEPRAAVPDAASAATSSDAEADDALHTRFRGFLARLHTSAPTLYEYMRVVVAALAKLHEHEETPQHAPESTKEKERERPEMPLRARAASGGGGGSAPRRQSSVSFQTASIFDYDPDELAQQLCLIDWRLLTAVPLREFHKLRWTRGEAPHIDAAMAHANTLSYYLVFRFLKQPDAASRLTAWTHLVRLGRRLFELRDFNSALVVYLALSNRHVERALHALRSEASKKTLRECDEFLAHMSPRNNFAHYRRLLRTLDGGPLIPCYEVHLKDLLYVCEASADWLDKAHKILNVAKMDALGRSIALFRPSLLSPYEFPSNPHLQSLLNMRGYDLDDLKARIAALSSLDVVPVPPTPRVLETAPTPHVVHAPQRSEVERFEVDWSAAPSEASAREAWLKATIAEFSMHVDRVQRRLAERERLLDARERALSQRGST